MDGCPIYTARKNEPISDRIVLHPTSIYGFHPTSIYGLHPTSLVSTLYLPGVSLSHWSVIYKNSCLDDHRSWDDHGVWNDDPVVISFLVWFFYFSIKVVYKSMMDTFGNCQRLVFSIDVSQRIGLLSQTCENLGSIGHQSCKRIMNKKHPLCLKSFYYLSEKLLLFQNLHYFRGSHFSQCFISILPTSPHCS